MVNVTIGNVLSLPWPYNPSRHFANLTGLGDANHTTIATMVYLQGQLPTPPVWICLNWLVSFSLAITAYLSMRDNPSKSWTASIRKPSITFNLFRTGLAIANCAIALASNRIPSCVTVVNLAFSLLPNVHNWRRRPDRWSAPALAAGTACWCLIVFQLHLDFGNKVEYGYGSAVLVGGRCPRPLEEGESCSSLKFLGCQAGVSGSPSGGPLITTRLSGYERVAGYIGAIVLPMGWIGLWPTLAYFFKNRRRLHEYENVEEQEDGIEMLSGGAGTAEWTKWQIDSDLQTQENVCSFTRCAALIYFVVMGFLMLLLLPEPAQVVDSMGHGHAVDSNAETMNATFWSDCFKIPEPSDGSGFVNLWLKQEWDGSAGRAASLFGFM
jgi:hypothetical protein